MQILILNINFGSKLVQFFAKKSFIINYNFSNIIKIYHIKYHTGIEKTRCDYAKIKF